MIDFAMAAQIVNATNKNKIVLVECRWFGRMNSLAASGAEKNVLAVSPDRRVAVSPESIFTDPWLWIPGASLRSAPE
jgi:hypothetical protein